MKKRPVCPKICVAEQRDLDLPGAFLLYQFGQTYSDLGLYSVPVNLLRKLEGEMPSFLEKQEEK